jgi:hypothetical protein
MENMENNKSLDILGEGLKEEVDEELMFESRDSARLSQSVSKNR